MIESKKPNDREYISLVDIVSICFRQKWLITIFVMMGLILGVASTLLIQKKYEYYAVMSIGHYGYGLRHGELSAKPIFVSSALKAHIQSIYLPDIRTAYRENDGRNLANLIVTPLQGDTALSLSAKITKSEQDTYKELYQKILLTINADEEVRLKEYDELLSRQLEFNQSQLKLKKQQIKNLRKYSEQFGTLSLADMLDNPYKNRKNIKRDSDRMSIKLKNNNMDPSQLDAIYAGQQLYYLISLKNTVSQYQYQLLRLKKNIRSINQELSSSRKSYFIVKPIIIRNVSTSNFVIIFISTFLFLVLGVFIILFKEFSKNE